jgi:hypothetical protein
VPDAQGPWWTRPPEPGPPAPPVQRRRIAEPDDAEADYPTAERPVTDRSSTVSYLPSAYAPSDPAQAEPAPPPPPPPAKPVIRRVAVIPPTPPPPRPVAPGSQEDLTESLPPVGDDIFATFSGPLPVGTAGPRAPGPSPAAGHSRPNDQLEGLDPDRPGLLQQINLPEPRVLLLGAAAALVVLLIVVVALLGGRPETTDPGAGAAVTKPSAAAAAKLDGRDPRGLKKVGSAAAIADLRKAGRGTSGTIVEAWGWEDKNGRNLVATSIASAGANDKTLRVIHVAGLDTDAVTLRLMRDSNLPARCNGAGSAGFTPGSLIVRDLNSDDYAEVLTGWSSRCGGTQNRSQIRLALITNGKKYILRGQGVIGKPGAVTPDPRPADWPNGFYKVLIDQYRRLYG